MIRVFYIYEFAIMKLDMKGACHGQNFDWQREYGKLYSFK